MAQPPRHKEFQPSGHTDDGLRKKESLRHTRATTTRHSGESRNPDAVAWISRRSLAGDDTNRPYMGLLIGVIRLNVKFNLKLDSFIKSKGGDFKG
jgi:hypothetical protein